MKSVFSLFVILGLTVSANALSLKEKKRMEEWKKYLQDPSKSYIGSVKEKCGKEISVTLDENMVVPFMKANADAATYCDATLSVISGMCADETAKAEILKKINKIVCKAGKKENSIELNLKGDTLTFAVGPKGTNLESAVKEFLENNL